MSVAKSPSAHKLSTVLAIGLLGLSGLLAAISAVMGESFGFKAWLLPLAPWSLGLCLYARLRKK